MRIQRTLATAAALLALASLTACEDTKDKTASPAADKAQTPAQPQAPKNGPASARSLGAAQAYVSQYTPCETLSIDPADKRLPSDDLSTVGAAVTAHGVCGAQREHAGVGLYLTPDMKKFQEAYYKRVMDRIAAGEPTYGLFSRVFVGEDFVAAPSGTEEAKALAKSRMRVLTCNPTFGVPDGYKKEKALVDYCVLSDFVNTQDDGKKDSGKKDDGQRAPEASLGLPGAGSLTELRSLVGSSVDCKQFSTDPATVAIRSIDYQPAIEGDHTAWGVRERGLCGRPGGAQRAHGLVWLDKVDDMAAFQSHEKAAQLKELQENGRIRATRSMVLVGSNIAVETNNASSRHGLYQQQFLHLDCRPGFTAPQGYRFEKAMVEGCVLTNYEG